MIYKVYYDNKLTGAYDYVLLRKTAEAICTISFTYIDGLSGPFPCTEYSIGKLFKEPIKFPIFNFS